MHLKSSGIRLENALLWVYSALSLRKSWVGTSSEGCHDGWTRCLTYRLIRSSASADVSCQRDYPTKQQLYGVIYFYSTGDIGLEV